MEAWKKTVDDFMAGKISPRSSVTIMSNTPLVLSLLGANKDLRVTTDYGKLKKILQEKHKLPESVLKQLPAAMADPIMIFDSATVAGDYVMMLDVKDDSGATVIVPVSFNYEQGRGYIVNYVPSVYTKKDITTGKPNNSWFSRQIEEGRLRYINKRKAAQWASSSRLQLPWVGTHLNGKTKVYTEADLVNLKNQNPTLYQFAGERECGAAAVRGHGRTETCPRGEKFINKETLLWEAAQSNHSVAGTPSAISGQSSVSGESLSSGTAESKTFFQTSGESEPEALYEFAGPAGRVSVATVVVPVALNARGRNKAHINIAKSAYAKEQNGKPSSAWFVKQAQKNARYINGQKWTLWASAQWANSPLVAHNASGNTVYTEADLVNLKNQNPTLYQGNRKRGCGAVAV